MKKFPIYKSENYIPWELAERAYKEFIRQSGVFGDPHNKMSMKLIEEIGGFSANELDNFLASREWRLQIIESELNWR